MKRLLILGLILSSVAFGWTSSLLEPQPHPSLIDRPILRTEVPQSERDITDFVSPLNAENWSKIVKIDFLFIAGYVLLLIALRGPMIRSAGPGNRIMILAVVTGLADCAENFGMLATFDLVAGQQPLSGSIPFTLLPFLGTLKWLCYFSTCIALSLSWTGRPIWGALKFLTLAASAMGIIGALGTIAKLHALPLLGCATLVSMLLLLIATLVRLFSVSSRAEAVTAACV